jgi:hypothetical protein
MATEMGLVESFLLCALINQRRRALVEVAPQGMASNLCANDNFGFAA